MLPKRLNEIASGDLNALVSEQRSESRTLEYKAELPGHGDPDKREFAADVASLANAAGGDILFGVAEAKDAQGKRLGYPDRIDGVACASFDAERSRLEQIARTNIEPRIEGLQIVEVAGFPRGSVIVLRVPQSWNGPHLVRQSGRFHGRGTGGKYDLDVREIRAAFLRGAEVGDFLRRFRDERLGRIIAGETPCALGNPDEPRFVLHVMPMAASDGALRLDPRRLAAEWATLRPISDRIHNYGFNLDGFVTVDRTGAGPAFHYAQAFRSGVLEFVQADVTDDGRLNGRWFEPPIVRAVQHALALLGKHGVPMPLCVMLSAVGARALRVRSAVDRPGAGQPAPVGRDVLVLPDCMLDTFEADIPQALRPAFDVLWQASGWSGSENYDEEGKWSPPPT